MSYPMIGWDAEDEWDDLSGTDDEAPLSPEPCATCPASATATSLTEREP